MRRGTCRVVPWIEREDVRHGWSLSKPARVVLRNRDVGNAERRDGHLHRLVADRAHFDQVAAGTKVLRADLARCAAPGIDDEIRRERLLAGVVE
jgi:hypothetical protein